MDIAVSASPWPHLTIDKAFDETEWQSIVAFINTITPSDIPFGDSVYTCVFDGEPDTNKHIYDIMHAFNMTVFDLHYSGLSSRQVDRSRLYSKLEFRFIGGIYNYPRHVDDSKNVMSNVLYVGPYGDWPGMGTYMFEEKDSSRCIEVEFQPNRVLSFVSESDRTWHAFGNPYKVMRKTVNMTLCEI